MTEGKPPKRWREVPQRPYQSRHAAVTSKMMAAVRSRNSKAEVLLRRQLWRAGYRFRLHARDLVGKPDIIFRSRRVAVFVDGDFWHGRGILQDGEAAFRETMRGSKSDWWVEKLHRTISRDKEVNVALAGMGWRVIRVWESAVLNDPTGIASRIRKVLDDERTVETAWRTDVSAYLRVYGMPKELRDD